MQCNPHGNRHRTRHLLNQEFMQALLLNFRHEGKKAIEKVEMLQGMIAGARSPGNTARAHRRGDRVSAPAASWCDPAGESPAQVRGSARLVVSVAWPLATVDAKRTQRLHGVWD